MQLEQQIKEIDLSMVQVKEAAERQGQGVEHFERGHDLFED